MHTVVGRDMHVDRRTASLMELAVFCRCVVTRASDWLRSNPDVAVRTCQTVTWTSHDLRTLASPSGAAGELMVLSRGVADSVDTYHLRGLRYHSHVILSLLPPVRVM